MPRNLHRYGLCNTTPDHVSSSRAPKIMHEKVSASYLCRGGSPAFPKLQNRQAVITVEDIVRQHNATVGFEPRHCLAPFDDADQRPGNGQHMRVFRLTLLSLLPPVPTKRKVTPEQFADELERHFLGTEREWDWDDVISVVIADVGYYAPLTACL